MASASDERPSLPTEMRVLELFAGIGGWRAAIQGALSSSTSDAGAPVALQVAAYDSCPYSGEVYRANFGEPCRARNIETMEIKEFEGFDVWVMSPPCQPFTTTRGAKQQGLEDKRCKALDHLTRLVPRLQRPPRWVAFENVKGFQDSDARNRWTAALLQSGFTFREVLLDLVNFGTPNHRMRYYLLAERSQRFAVPLVAQPVPSEGAALGPLPPGVLARGPWAAKRRAEIDAAHARARAAQGEEAKAAEFQVLRQNFEQELRVLARSGSEGEADQPFSFATSLSEATAWKLVPLPRQDPEAFVVVFAASRDHAPRFLADLDEAGLPNGEAQTEVTWSSTDVAIPGGRPISDFLQAELSPEERAELEISLDVLGKPYAGGLSYVGPADKRSFCFTGGYGKVLHKSSGSLLHLPTADMPAELDRANMTAHHGAVRLFSPKEIANILGFPRDFTFPPGPGLRHRYKAAGNSIAVSVAELLLRSLLLGEYDVRVNLDGRAPSDAGEG